MSAGPYAGTRSIGLQPAKQGIDTCKIHRQVHTSEVLRPRLVVAPATAESRPAKADLIRLRRPGTLRRMQELCLECIQISAEIGLTDGRL